MSADFSFLKTSRFWKDMVVLVIGILAAAAAVYYFLVPSKLIIGSISGVAIIVNELLGNTGINLSVSMLVLVMNVILLLLAYIFLGAEVGIKTVIASLLLGPFMNLWGMICPYEKLIEPGMNSVMGEPIFDLLGYVLLLGLSQAFLFRINTSSGGLDIIAMIMKKYLHWDIGTSVSVAGFAVCLGAFLIHPFRMVVIGIIGTWLNGVIVDYFTASINKRKRVCIISPDYDKLREYIIYKLVRTCSLYKVQGGYTGEDNVEIQAILTQSEFANLLEYIKKNEIKAFITAGNCSEVYGLWFTHKRQKQEAAERQLHEKTR